MMSDQTPDQPQSPQQPPRPQYQQPHQYPPNYQPRQRKEPGIAVLLNFFYTGAGNVYAENVNNGIVMIIVTTVLLTLSLFTLGAGLCLMLPYWIWGMFSANKDALEYNRRHNLG